MFLFTSPNKGHQSRNYYLYFYRDWKWGSKVWFITLFTLCVCVYMRRWALELENNLSSWEIFLTTAPTVFTKWAEFWSTAGFHSPVLEFLKIWMYVVCFALFSVLQRANRNSLVVQWLRLGHSLLWIWVSSLDREVRSHKLCSVSHTHTHTHTHTRQLHCCLTVT